MALNPKNIIGAVTGAGKAAVSEVTGLAKRFNRGEDDTVIPTPEAGRTSGGAAGTAEVRPDRHGEAQPLGRHEDRAREVRRGGHGDQVAPRRQAAQPDGGHRRPEGRCCRRPEVGDRAQDDREAEAGGRQAEARAGSEAQARGRDAEARGRDAEAQARGRDSEAEGPCGGRAEAGGGRGEARDARGEARDAREAGSRQDRLLTSGGARGPAGPRASR